MTYTGANDKYFRFIKTQTCCMEKHISSETLVHLIVRLSYQETIHNQQILHRGQQ